jgi:hypothetical protein
MFIVPFQEKNGQKPLFFDFSSAEITPEHSGLEIHAQKRQHGFQLLQSISLIFPAWCLVD